MRSMLRRVGMFTAAAVAITLLASCGSGSAGDPVGAGTSGNPSAHSSHSGFSPPPPAPLRNGEHFVNLAMPQPYTPKAPGGGTDEYRCFLVDPKITTNAFLTGSQFLPQNADIVHHAIFFRISPADADNARKIDSETAGDGWTCFGDSGVSDDAAWVAHWAPGANETLLAPGLGYQMPAGSLLVMQVHYNLLATGGKAGSADQSAIRLRLTGADTLTPLETAQLPAPVELPCTSTESGPLCDRNAAVNDVASRFGDDAKETVTSLLELCNDGKALAPGATQHCDIKAPQGLTVHAVAGHMHLLGRSIKIELNPATPTAQTLLDIPAYNFDDQAIRPLATPVTIKPGDTIRTTCTHDAGLRKLLPQLSVVPPRYVVWGDGTSDEMCLGLLIWSPAA